MGLVALGCALEAPELLRSQISQAHQTGDSILAYLCVHFFGERSLNNFFANGRA
jgi:hypothetical protein